ncbi:MAG: ATP-binding protein [Waterburya sp.]
MFSFLEGLIFSRQYIPHRHSYFWQPGLLWLHLLSDVFIALAYYSIALALTYFIRQGEDIPFKGIFILFSLLIFSCGTIHIMSIWTVWHPDYWLLGLIKAITAIISIFTALEMIRTIPKAIDYRQRIEETLRKTNQELRSSNEELEKFADLASHDLREPLRMVTSFTQLLAQRYSGKLDADADQIIGFAVDGSTRMEELIHDLLEYSRVGKQDKSFAIVDCESVLDCSSHNLQLLIQETDATIARMALPTVIGEQGQLIQLFQNLIENAIVYRSQESPRIEVGAEAQAEQWLFSVKDNGIGIDPQYQDRIFQIFQRLHTRQEYPGTGIGLAICHKIVERHGGKIWVESAAGEGATFYFTLPKAKDR